jgi:hypothetical protein
MSLDLSDAFERLVADHLRSGTYPSAETLLREALHALDAHRLHVFAEGQSRRLIDEGVAALSTGPFFDAEDVFDQLDVGLDDAEPPSAAPDYVLSAVARQDLFALKEHLLATRDRRETRFVLRGVEEAMRFLASRPPQGNSSGHALAACHTFGAVIVYQHYATPLQVARILSAPGCEPGMEVLRI